MDIIIEALIDGGVIVLGAIIVAFGTGLSNLIRTFTDERRAKVGEVQYQREVEIAHTLVSAADQIFGTDENLKKLEYAKDNLIKQVNEIGIDLDDTQATALVESAVKSKNLLEESISESVTPLQGGVELDASEVGVGHDFSEAFVDPNVIIREGNPVVKE